MDITMLEPTQTASLPGIESLMDRYYTEMVRLAISILGEPEEAEDAAQEAFIAAAVSAHGFRGNASPKTWLYSITVNACMDHLRRRKSRQALGNVLQAIQAVFTRSQETEEAVIQADEDSRLWAEVNRLDEKHRIPVLLYYMYELPVQEISQILGVGPGTVHSRLFYARKQLLHALQDQAAVSRNLPEVLP
jgi:RNA polymerase sigma-70 factor (ECF subfamily)